MKKFPLVSNRFQIIWTTVLVTLVASSPALALVFNPSSRLPALKFDIYSTDTFRCGFSDDHDCVATIYDKPAIDSLAQILRSENATNIARIDSKLATLQSSIDQGLGGQSKGVEDRISKLEAAIFQSLNKFDQRILNHEALNILREEMKSLIRAEVAQHMQLGKSAK